MKPLQIVVLVVAGALGGAVVMRVWRNPRPSVSAPAPAVAQVETPAPALVPAPEPTVVEPPVVKHAAVTAPAPVRSRKPVPVHRPRATPPRPAPVIVASSGVAKSEPAPGAVKPVIVPEAVARPPAPQPSVPAFTPPARPEPEHVTPPPPQPEPPRVTLNAGMLIPVRLVDGLSSERNQPGDAFTATLYRELVADDFVIAERGARVEGRVVAADRGSRVKGVSIISVELTRIYTSDGQVVPIQTDTFERRSEPNTGRDVEKIGGGAALGAIIGALAGGGKGAAIGAGAGGGAGAGAVLLTRKPATLPSETRITFRLRAPLTVTEKRPE